MTDLKQTILNSYQTYKYEINITNINELNVKGDGNCLFRCISYMLYDSEEYHVIIRNKIIDYAQDNGDNFLKSSNLDCTLYEWSKKMSNFGEYGDAFTIEILCWMLEIPIYVSVRNIYDQEYSSEIFGNWFSKQPIKLILRGNHYTLVL